MCKCNHSQSGCCSFVLNSVQDEELHDIHSMLTITSWITWRRRRITLCVGTNSHVRDPFKSLMDLIVHTSAADVDLYRNDQGLLSGRIPQRR